MIQLDHPDRVRTWLNGLPERKQAHGSIVEGSLQTLRVCLIGAACDTARVATDRFQLVSGRFGPRFVLGADTGVASDIVLDPWVLAETVEWLGFDLHDVVVNLFDLPAGLRTRVNAVLDAVRQGLGPMIADGLEAWEKGHPHSHAAAVYPGWVLNDAGVPFSDLADCVRIALRLDLHLVAGTPEHDAVTRLHEREIAAWARAGELDRTGVPTLLAVLDRLDEWPELVTEDDARRLGPTVYGSYVQAVEAAVADAEEWAAAREAAVLADETLVGAA